MKIEGRMKTALYVATVARTYRKAIDDYLEDPAKYQARICPGIRNRSQAAPTVSLQLASFMENQSEEAQIYDNNTYEKGYTYLGIVQKL